MCEILFITILYIDYINYKLNYINDIDYVISCPLPEALSKNNDTDNHNKGQQHTIVGSLKHSGTAGIMSAPLTISKNHPKWNEKEHLQYMR